MERDRGLKAKGGIKRGIRSKNWIWMQSLKKQGVTYEKMSIRRTSRGITVKIYIYIKQALLKV